MQNKISRTISVLIWSFNTRTKENFSSFIVEYLTYGVSRFSFKPLFLCCYSEIVCSILSAKAFFSVLQWLAAGCIAYFAEIYDVLTRLQALRVTLLRGKTVGSLHNTRAFTVYTPILLLCNIGTLRLKPSQGVVTQKL